MVFLSALAYLVFGDFTIYSQSASAESNPLSDFFMDKLDYCRPFYPVECDNTFFRWTVGFYPENGRNKRVILAWFQYMDDASAFLEACRRDHPNCHYDLLRTFF